MKKGGGGPAAAQNSAAEESKAGHGLQPVKKAVAPKKSTGERLDELEQQLETTQWVGGQKLSSLDKEAVEEIMAAGGVSLISPLTSPNTYAWYAFASKFTPEVRQSWPKAKAA